jgi:transcription-repair coupling factor (superfamily II helicase)
MPSDTSDLIRQHMAADPAFSRLTQGLSGKKATFNVVGPPDSLKSWLAWQLGAKTGRRPCLLVADELRARTVAAELAALLEDPVFIFRPRELNLTDAEASSRELDMQRMAILGKLLDDQYGALVVPAGAVLQKLPPSSLFQARFLHFFVGQKMDLDDGVRQLIRNGYEHMRLTDGPGQFARRGDILDIVVPSAEDDEAPEGFRISFFDDEIDAIKHFDPQTQRSSAMLQEVSIPPVRELLPDPAFKDELASQILACGETAAQTALANGAAREIAAAMRQLAGRDADRVSQNVHFAALDRWIKYVQPRPVCILDYARETGCLVLLDEPLRIRNRIDAAQADLDERLRAMLTKGQALPQWSEITFRSDDIGLSLDRIRPLLAMSQIASPGNALPDAELISLQARPADGYRGRETQLLDQAADWLRQSWTLMLFAGSEHRRERLGQLFQERGIAPLIVPESLPRGFVWPAARLAVLGTQDVFGSERPARRKRQSGGIKIDLFSDLVPGELVVHEAHGIGRYDGLVNMENNGTRRDYLKIMYAGDDSLYIPMESLDQIQKYVGADSREPRLSKLGGQEWTRMKERARSSIRKLATDLVRLYAERAAIKGKAFAPDAVWQQEFEEQFPYEETADQLRSVQEIKADMESERVMDRLLCGDVGFGKTEVAFRAIFKCVMDGCQAVLLAPTTVLAQQHYDNLVRRMAGFPVQIGLLSRFASEAMQKNTLSGLLHGKVDVAVGTHRLLSQDVRLKKLGLLVIDEEQRFGVDHKEKLKALWPEVDVLTLSATPIPRTLHMAMSGIRDISVLEEPPHDRRPVQTYVMEYDRELVAEAILREVSRQGQVFYLYNDTRRILEKAAELEQQLPGARIVCAHGKMNEKLLEDIISGFIAQESDILVCTTIIESGIDMPNVNTIIVEDADRLGLAQLYQLRGRVGRSDRQAYAYITYRRDKALTEIAEKRLAAIRDFTELGAGFKIALRDLEVRGAGNLLGAEQHGQLEAIGYDLYCRMLEESIQELQGQRPARQISAVIDLDIDAFVAKRYIPDEGQRMDMYRRIADIRSFADYQDVLDECLDRFGDLPPEALALADIAYIRSVAGRHGFGRIHQHQENLVMSYDESASPDMGVLARLIGRPEFKGQLLFNAGTRPYLVYRSGARQRQRIAENLRKLFQVLDPDVAQHDKEAS